MSKTLKIEYLHGEIRDVTVDAAMTAREFYEMDDRFVVAVYTEGCEVKYNLMETRPGEPPGYKYAASDGTEHYLGFDDTVYVNFVDDALMADWARQLKDLKKQHAIKASKAKPEAE